jgi:glycolate oxidase
MHYTQINEAHLAYFVTIVGTDNVITNDDLKYDYGKDNTEDLHYMPSCVITVTCTLHVSQVLQYCNTHLIPVTPRGAGTGLSGGALPVMGGVLLSLHKMNKIIAIDQDNLQATVEPGVINYNLQEAVKAVGLFYPPDPASWGSCMMGGNVAHASGGPRAVKYGTTRDYILNLEVVLPNGDVIFTGANTLKYSTGYNLTHLIIGSEGTLAIVTKIIVKLIPHNTKNVLMLIPFASAIDACKAVNTIFKAGITPSACEFMERDALEFVSAYDSSLTVNLSPQTQAHLLLELDGNSLPLLQQQAEQIVEVIAIHNPLDVMYADDEQQKELLWKARRKIGEAVKHQSAYKEEDTVVPRASMPDLLYGVKKIGEEFGFKSVCYGHAGDGNLHVNIIKDNLTQHQWDTEIPKAIRKIFVLCKQLGGTISGEHGIGLVQKQYMDVVMTPVHISLFKAIKHSFDPNNILNPGKIF